jgi:hypothetical protein
MVLMSGIHTYYYGSLYHCCIVHSTIKKDLNAIIPHPALLDLYVVSRVRYSFRAVCMHSTFEVKTRESSSEAHTLLCVSEGCVGSDLFLLCIRSDTVSDTHRCAKALE